MSPIPFTKKDDDGHQEEINNHESDDIGEWTWTSKYKVDNLDYQQQ